MSSSSVSPSDPTTPPHPDNLQWITAYFTTHSLSVPSRRYSFLLWVAVVFIFLCFAILHWTGAKGGSLGAYWSKWSLPRRTWRTHAAPGARRDNTLIHRPISLPSNAQLLSLSGMVLVSFALVFVGPDYLAPGLEVWQFGDRAARAAPSNSYPLQHTISKSLWTSSARFGQIAFALFPLCVLFALKAPPFAIFAIPFMIQLFFDKLVWLHRWSGRLIWFLTTIHVVLWSIRLARDRNPDTGRSAYIYAFTYQPFFYGWIAFVLLTLIIFLSFRPIRRRFYESFYLMHVLLVPLTLLTAALHHPSVGFWCWAALAIWISERLWRATWWFYSNGFVRSAPATSSLSVSLDSEALDNGSLEMDYLQHPSFNPLSLQSPSEVYSKRSSSPLNHHYDRNSPISSGVTTCLLPTTQLPHFAPGPTETKSFLYPPHLYIPPPGYAHAELLPGRTVRLRLITPRLLSWAPGQHFLLHIPSISRFTSHPFTCASVCDEQAPGHEGRLMVFLVRARKGWTEDLWNTVARMIANRSQDDSLSPGSTGLPTRGVILRTFVDGPFGSSIRARWGDHSTAVLITGGSGVSFGLSILQYLCLCLSGRDGRHFGGVPGVWGRKVCDTQRVRFIWLLREYSHVQWCASVIRRCMAMVPPSSLQVDIYVTNFKPAFSGLPAPPPPSLPPSRVRFPASPVIHEELQHPQPNFARSDVGHLRSGSSSSSSIDSHESCESDVDFSYFTGEYTDGNPTPEALSRTRETDVLELTNFHGEEDFAFADEKNLSLKVKRQGRLRRLQSRQQTMHQKRNLKPGQTAHLQPLPGPPPARTHRYSALSTQSVDGLLSADALSDHRQSLMSESDGVTSLVQPEPQVWSRPPSGLSIPVDYPTVTLVTPPPMVKHGLPSSEEVSMNWDSKAEAGRSRPTLPPLVTQKPSDLSGLEMSEREAQDVDVVSEYVRPGKPKLDRMIADEVEQSRGSVVVACCGPTSLDAIVREIIADQIRPERIRRGDMRGLIELVSEEFEY